MPITSQKKKKTCVSKTQRRVTAVQHPNDVGHRSFWALTLVHKLQFGDNVEAHFGELVLEHLEEHGQEMIDRPFTKILALLACLNKLPFGSPLGSFP